MLHKHTCFSKQLLQTIVFSEHNDVVSGTGGRCEPWLMSANCFAAFSFSSSVPCALS